MNKIKEIRIRLKDVEPRFIEKKLLPEIYFKEDEKNTEYWVFFYRYVRKLGDETIGVRLGYERKSIYNICLRIIKNNLTTITEFLHKLST